MSETQRIDKWLWHARVARTRTSAAGLVTGGQVRVNSARVVKPGHGVRAGDVVTVGMTGRVMVLRVEALAARRGPAPEARLTYTDLSPPPLPRPPAAFREPGTGRPTKRDRRAIESLKRGVPRSGDSAE